jgi:hypothetical protein
VNTALAAAESFLDRKVLGVILRPPGPLKVEQGSLTISDHGYSLTAGVPALQASPPFEGGEFKVESPMHSGRIVALTSTS